MTSTINLANYDWIDVHYHAAPDLYTRRYNVFEAGHYYQDHNGLVVLKSHLGATTTQALLAQQQGLPVLGSLVLNDIAGGIDLRVINHALLNYCLEPMHRVIIHLPTITGRAYQSRLTRRICMPKYAQKALKPLTITDEQGQLRKDVKALVQFAADHPIVLSTGHASKSEVYQLIEYALKYPSVKLMLNQPANPLTNLSYQALKPISQEKQIFIEQTLLTYLIGHQTSEDFNSVMSNLDNVIYSSDLGQPLQPDINEFFEWTQNYFNEQDIPIERQEALVKTTPLKMLSL